MYKNCDIVVYTDGSSIIKKDFYESSGAIIITVNGHEVYRYGEYFPDGTNSKGEVYAMKFAYDKLHKLIDVDSAKSITFICDSEYVVNSVNKWIYSWQKNNWLTSSGVEPKFCDVFKYLYDTYLNKKVRNKKIKVYHINSHQKDLAKARRKFQAKNNIDVTQDEYDKYTYYNDAVDKFANDVRFMKKNLEYYSNLLSNDPDNKRDGLFVIKKRIKA